MPITEGDWKAVKMSKRIGEADWCITFNDAGEHVADVIYEEADAKLMAASPKLLAACQNYNRVITAMYEDNPNVTVSMMTGLALIEANAIGRQAIAKATQE